jgi:hypothetical protein
MKDENEPFLDAESKKNGQYLRAMSLPGVCIELDRK